MGACVAVGGMCGSGGHVWQWGVCMAGGVHGTGHAWGVCGGGHVWQWGCVHGGGMHGGGCVWQGHAWQGGVCGGGRRAWQIL